MVKRAAIYARVSTDEQGQGYSLPTQLESCRKYATERGYVAVAEFTDTHTGTEIERPGLNDLYRFLEKKGVEVLVVHDLDRLSREVGNQAIIEVEMSRAGVEIEYVLGQYAKTPEGELMKIIKAGIAQYENRQRVERSRRGKIGRAKAGYVLLTPQTTPYGYDYVSEEHKGWLVINEEQAQVVRGIFAWLVEEGLSSYAIARRLWERRIPSKGDLLAAVSKKTGRGEWCPTTVRKMLSNTVYKGVWYYGKSRWKKVNGKSVRTSMPQSEWIAVPVPAIVDEEMWERAQECLLRNKQMAKRNTKRDYLLRGMIFCPCGRRWTGRFKVRPPTAYYLCPSTEAEPWREKCDARFSIRQDVLEPAVWEKVTSFILDPENLRDEIERMRAGIEGESSRRVHRLEAINMVSADLDRKMSILLDEVLAGGFSQAVIKQKQADLLAQRTSLEAEAQQIRQELEAMTITPDQEAELIGFARQMKDRLNDLTFEHKRRILELIHLRVDVLHRTRVKLTGVISSEGLIVDLEPSSQ